MKKTQGNLLILSPADGESGWWNTRIFSSLNIWANKDGSGVVFDSSTGFVLPSGSMRSPDAAGVSRSRLSVLTKEQKRKFILLCPDFVIEILSFSDSLKELQEKMEEYGKNDARLGWLIDPESRMLYIYRSGEEKESVCNPGEVSGAPLLPSFVLISVKFGKQDFEMNTGGFSDLLQFIIMGLQRGSIYALAAMGFNIIYNATGIINFAQGEFVVLGGLMMVTLTMNLNLSIPFAFLLTVLFVTVVGILMERFTINPVKSPSVMRLIIITIAVSILLKGAAMCIWGKESHYMRHFSGDEPLEFLGATILPQTLWIIGILILVVVAFIFFFNHTMTGKCMRACAINRDAARLAGISDRNMVMLSFALSAGIGAVAGIIITPIIQMDYGRGIMIGLKGFGAAVVGGLGNSMGAVVAGILLGVVEAIGGGYISSHYMDAIALLILLIVLFVRPSGIFGSSEAARLKDF
ncbi:MAG: Uma2 family endonuclease [Desulfobacterales bacterium]